MYYHELPAYTGPLTSCKTCLRVFRPGEVITLADDGKLLFCYSGPESGCLQEHMFVMKPPRALYGEPMVYRRRSAEPNVGRSDSPVSLWQKLWERIRG